MRNIPTSQSYYPFAPYHHRLLKILQDCEACVKTRLQRYWTGTKGRVQDN